MVNGALAGLDGSLASAPMDVHTGRAKEVLAMRPEIKKRTLQARRLQNLQSAGSGSIITSG